MVRLFAAIVLTVAGVAFTIANTHHVPLSFVFGNAVHVRMIFLLLSVYICGVVTAVIWQQVTVVKQKQFERRMPAQLKSASVKE